MNEELITLARSLASGQRFDRCFFAVLDLDQQTHVELNLRNGEDTNERPFFDLASLTKPLTLSFFALNYPQSFQKRPELEWLLNHRASLPSGGRLSEQDWREQILSYPLKLAPTDLYSDYSALRLMLEIEATTGQSLYSQVRSFWDSEVLHWRELVKSKPCVTTGLRGGKVIQGDVHDDNAFVLKQELSHAGLFATGSGLCRTLLAEIPKHWATLERSLEATSADRRFVLGFDRPQDRERTLAGRGCSPFTIGHLGFTGTSFWLDLKRRVGWVLLTNQTQYAWYEREGLQGLRRSLGEAVWRVYARS